jgi:ABC-type transport system involved in multi-copper enzyme maturation permease subunit
MIRMKQVMAIARAERRIIRRLTRYWLFWGLSYLIALVACFWYSYWHGLCSSYSATIGLCSPYFLVSCIGVYYLLIYVLGAVFLAFDIRAGDIGERMDEVLDSRSYTNLELVIGQFLGILIPSWIPMLILAILIELLGQLVVADAIRWSPSAGK